jgi:hypothetical protein
MQGAAQPAMQEVRQRMERGFAGSNSRPRLAPSKSETHCLSRRSSAGAPRRFTAMSLSRWQWFSPCADKSAGNPAEPTNQMRPGCGLLSKRRHRALDFHDKSPTRTIARSELVSASMRDAARFRRRILCELKYLPRGAEIGVRKVIGFELMYRRSKAS